MKRTSSLVICAIVGALAAPGCKKAPGSTTSPSSLSVTASIVANRTFLLGQAVSLVAQASGSSGTLKYSWSFGDGGTDTSGASVAHKYLLLPGVARTGKYTASVSVTDGTASGNATVDVTVGTLTGCWTMPATAPLGALDKHLLTQTQASITGTVFTGAGGTYPLESNPPGSVADTGAITYVRHDLDRKWALVADSTLAKLTGTEEHTDLSRDNVTLTYAAPTCP